MAIKKWQFEIIVSAILALPRLPGDGTMPLHETETADCIHGDKAHKVLTVAFSSAPRAGLEAVAETRRMPLGRGGPTRNLYRLHDEGILCMHRAQQLAAWARFPHATRSAAGAETTSGPSLFATGMVAVAHPARRWAVSSTRGMYPRSPEPTACWLASRLVQTRSLWDAPESCTCERVQVVPPHA